MFLTKYGTQWGAVPMTTGNVWWVAPSSTYQVGGNSYSADDGNGGASPELAFRNLSAAVSAATANNGDVIALLPGTHTTTSALAVSKAGLSFVGVPYMQEDDPMYMRPQVTITGTGAIGVAVTAADVSFYNIRFLPVTQFQAMTFTTAADRLLVKNCYIDMRTAVGHANTKGICATGATQTPRGIRLVGNYIEGGVITTSAGYAVDVGAAINFRFAKNLIVHDGALASAVAWTTAVKINDNATGIVSDNDVQSNEVSVGITKVFAGVTMTGAGSIYFLRNTTTVQTACLLIDDFAAADVDLNLNYVATVAGGAGGTLITAST